MVAHLLLGTSGIYILTCTHAILPFLALLDSVSGDDDGDRAIAVCVCIIGGGGGIDQYYSNIPVLPIMRMCEHNRLYAYRSFCSKVANLETYTHIHLVSVLA